MRRMDLLALSIELPSLFTLAESLPTLLFGGFDLLLDLCSNLSGFRTGSLGLCRIRTAHGFRLPFTDALPHESWAVRFPHIPSVHKQINDRDITPIVIDLKFPASQSIEQAWAHIPVPLEGKA